MNAFDDIGNRTTVKTGGDNNGSSASLRTASYTPNLLNQYSQRTVPASFDVLGIANSATTVTVNSSAADYRRGDYFQELVTANNASAADWKNVSVTTSGGGSASGSVFVPKTPEPFTHDLDGNTLTDGRWTYTWDAENRLTVLESFASAPSASRQKLEFEYDFLGRRISKKVSNWNGSAYVLQSQRKFLYDGWNVVAEVNQSNTLLRTYLWGLDLSGTLQGAGGIGGLLDRADSGASGPWATTFYHSDGNGNVTLLFDAMQNVAARYDYDPFGNTLALSGPLAAANTYRFSSKEVNLASGLYHFGARFYHPNLQRWLNHDPSGFVDGPNLYAYVGNRPTDAYDAWGLEQLDLIKMYESINRVPSNWVSDGGRLGFEPTQPIVQVERYRIRYSPLLKLRGPTISPLTLFLGLFSGMTITAGDAQYKPEELEKGIILSEGQWVDGDGNIRDKNGNLVTDQLNPLNPINKSNNPKKSYLLGFEDGLRTLANELNADHFLSDGSVWKDNFLRAAEDPNSHFSVKLDGLWGNSPENQVMNSVNAWKNGTGKNTDFELFTLHELSRLDQVDFYQGGKLIRNPFK